VINQLVKLNIVEDRSILRKKRAKKPRKLNNNEYEEEDGGSDEEDGGGDEEPDAETSDDENDESDLNDEMSTEFSNMLAVVKNSEHVDQLEWIKSRLNGAADDRAEDDDWQPLPLVTLTEESELALRDKSFQKLLKKIGLASPTNEQERYWRIPDNLSPDQLRKAVADLEADTPDANNPIHSEHVMDVLTTLWR
ncbi:timeless homolog, partial [Paramuricea clavata]